MTEYVLPPKTQGFLRRLRAEYAHDGESALVQILDASRFLVVPETFYDNWNGGTYGHDVRLFLPDGALAKVRVQEQKGLCERLRDDLNACSQAYENEHYRAVTIEADDSADPEARQASSIAGRPRVDPASLSIWRPGLVRVFVSHRDAEKVAAKALADALEGFGVSAFIAHDTIEPMATWRAEILKGLDTMEVMLAFVTDGFHDSTWTNQEVGYALGRNVPVVPLKMGAGDPAGLIEDLQAVKGRTDDIEGTAAAVYKVLADKLGNRERLQTGLISAFVQSPSFSDAKDRFDRMEAVVERLSDDEVRRIVEGFRDNGQLHNAGYLTSRHDRVRTFLERATGTRFRTAGRKIERVLELDEETIPF